MTGMTEAELEREGRLRQRKFRGAVATVVLGSALAGLGFVFAHARTGDEATLAGVMAGVGVGLVLGGLAFVWRMRPGNRSWQTESAFGIRDRLQARRSHQLFLFPIVALIMLAAAYDKGRDILAGDGRLVDYVWILLPVLYAWVCAAIVMGWDGQSRHNRRFLEDEMSLAMRARAMTAAFFVLMTGTTAALVLGLFQPLWGVLALTLVLAGAGMTAGVRFAWLDHEAGRENG